MFITVYIASGVVSIDNGKLVIPKKGSVKVMAIDILNSDTGTQCYDLLYSETYPGIYNIEAFQ